LVEQDPLGQLLDVSLADMQVPLLVRSRVV
jgi:hypothetical protein